MKFRKISNHDFKFQFLILNFIFGGLTHGQKTRIAKAMRRTGRRGKNYNRAVTGRHCIFGNSFESFTGISVYQGQSKGSDTAETHIRREAVQRVVTAIQQLYKNTARRFG
jgi:hypothetical protein